ncbi:hypothetical protein AAF712_016551 [Marasmius tenuissimus]|uniref:O-methyltransferase C-terminal domain-containing protein n=1 Tax=Marasmius tenuissimus TaxID=585030 RepID=A0ABR2Z5F9_9AGAR
MSTVANTLSEVHELLSLVTDGIASFEQTGAPFPVLHNAYGPPSIGKEDEKTKYLGAIITAAALQLAAIFQPPQNSLLNLASGAHKTAALRVCLEGNVTEILRDAGPKVCVIVELVGLVDYNILLRGLITDEASKANMLSWETITDRAYPAITPLNKAFPIPKCPVDISVEGNGKLDNIEPVTMFDLLQRPEEALRHRRFAVAMEGMSAVQPLDCLSRAYEWESLPDKAVIVDVGGGVGTISLELATRYPNLRFVVQDLPGFIEKGFALWKKRNPEALDCGQVILEVHDFFTPQPRKDASIFLLRHVVHNWSDEDSIKILTRLREAALKDTTLIVLEIIMPYACRASSSQNLGADPELEAAIPGASSREAPVPLLPNFGVVNEFAYLMDMTMFALGKDCYERTIGQFALLFRKAGWKLTRVNRLAENAGMWQAIEGIPV